MIYAPSSRDLYTCDIFAGIIDAMYDIDNNEDPNRWEYVDEQLAVVTHAIESASKSIEMAWEN